MLVCLNYTKNLASINYVRIESTDRTNLNKIIVVTKDNKDAYVLYRPHSRSEVRLVIMKYSIE